MCIMITRKETVTGVALKKEFQDNKVDLRIFLQKLPFYQNNSRENFAEFGPNYQILK